MTEAARREIESERNEAHVYLTAFLKPLEKWLRHERVAEIFINRPGEFWVEVAGGAMQRVASDDITDHHLQRLAAQIARSSKLAMGQPALGAGRFFLVKPSLQEVGLR